MRPSDSFDPHEDAPKEPGWAARRAPASGFLAERLQVEEVLVAARGALVLHQGLAAEDGDAQPLDVHGEAAGPGLVEVDAADPGSRSIRRGGRPSW